MSDTDIKDALDQGATDLHEIQNLLGAGTGCGACREYTKELIEQSLAEGSRNLAYPA